MGSQQEDDTVPFYLLSIASCDSIKQFVCHRSSFTTVVTPLWIKVFSNIDIVLDYN